MLEVSARLQPGFELRNETRRKFLYAAQYVREMMMTLRPPRTARRDGRLFFLLPDTRRTEERGKVLETYATYAGISYKLVAKSCDGVTEAVR